MPPLPRLRIAVLDDLARQLRFAPAETLRRQLDRARQMAPEIDPAINYPEDWIIFRITGYRPQIEAPAMLVGEALLSDISALVERLSAAADIDETELQAGGYLDAREVCSRWRISRKTLDRYRRAGLLALRVRSSDGRVRHVFPRDAVDWFESRNAARLAEAHAFDRLGPDLERRMLRRAVRYASAGLTLNQAAERIARRYRRGHETVRQLLRRSPTMDVHFQERGPPDERERRLIERAYWLAIDPGRTARHLGRSRASVQRIITDGRARLLCELQLPQPTLSPARPRSRSADAAAETALASRAATTGLNASGETNLLLLVQQARSTSVLPSADEHARALAYHALLARAAVAIRALPAHGAQARIVDRIETDLRWAGRLKTVLIRSQLGQLVRTFESSLARPLEDVRSGLLLALIREGLSALGEAVDHFEPRKGGRLAATAGLALNRTFARFSRQRASELAAVAAPQRASPRLLSTVTIPDWTLDVAPWQRCHERWWLEPDPRIRIGMHALEPQERTLLIERFGWDGAPRTHQELARHFETTSIRIAQRQRKAMRQALDAARAEAANATR